MKSPDLKKIIQPSMPVISLLLLIYIGIWILQYIFISGGQEYPATNLTLLSLQPLWLSISIFGITLFNILLIIQLNSKFTIIRVKSFLPVLFYALFISVWQDAHYLWSSHLALTAFLIGLMLYFSMYRDRKAVEPAFLGTLLLSLIGLVNPVYLFLIPISWIGFAILKSLSLKVFLASVIGLLVPWIFYFSYQWWMGNAIVLFDNIRFDLQPASLITGKALHDQIYIAIAILLLIITVFSIYTNLLNDTVQTRKYIHLILLYLISFIFIEVVLTNNVFALLPFIAFCLSMLLAHPFSLNKSKMYPIVFIVFLVVNFVYLIFNHFTI